MDHSAPSTRIVVLDAHETVQWGIRAALARSGLARRCVGASSLPAAITTTRRYAPHLAIVGQVRGAGQHMAIEALRRERPQLRVLALAEPRLPLPPVDARVPATAALAELAAVVRELSGASDPGEPPADKPTLSARQQEVLAGLSSGMTNQEIAASLGLSPDTVKWHVSSLCRRLGARNRAEVVARAHRPHRVHRIATA